MARKLWIGTKMPNPIVGVAKVVAKKFAKDAAKKSVGKIVKGSDVAKAIKKPFSVPSNAHPKLHDKVSSRVKTVPSAAMKKSNAPFSSTSGAKQAKAENARLTAKATKAEAKANARGLKAANKKVSKKNAGVGGSTMEGILKRATPARANRTRLGKSAFKSK
jgi:hypothetical protein